MAHRKIHKNFDLFSTYDYFTPGVRGIVMLTVWFIIGNMIGAVVTAIITSILGGIEDVTSYAMLVAYPVMFIPPMMYASFQSRSNSFFGTGYKLSSNHYKPLGGPFCALLVVMSTLTASFLADGVGSLLPEMPEWLEDALESMTQGKLWANIICVSIFAPIFEEWLCRGEVLRGLLNFEHKDKSGETVRGIKPVWAVVISAAFFAIIHGNPWQAVPAFALGCLFGYVYYRTGSLKLTMLMHCANNTFAVIMSNIDRFKDMDNWLDVMSPWLYAAISLFCAAFILYFIHKMNSITPQDPQGSCDRISA